MSMLGYLLHLRVFFFVINDELSNIIFSNFHSDGPSSKIELSIPHVHEDKLRLINHDKYHDCRLEFRS